MYKVTIGKSVFAVEQAGDEIIIDGEKTGSDILEYRNGKFHILSNNKSYTAEVLSSDPAARSFSIRVNSNIYSVFVKDRYDELLEQMGIDAGAGKKVNDIKAPMPGMVLRVMVESGQTIKKGDALLVLEAMKMENILKSPADGIVRKINVIKGDKVEKNQVMVNLD